jgi:hypothetical protein
MGNPMLRDILITIGWAAVAGGTLGLFKAKRIFHIAEGAEAWWTSTATAMLGIVVIMVGNVVH